MKRGNTHAEFFLEIGCEEIPAWMIPAACQEVKVLLEKHLGAAKLLENAEVTTYGGPRRLAAEVASILLRQKDNIREITGPPKSAAYDAAGNPTRAAKGFAAKQGVAVEKLYLVSSPKGEHVAARQVTPGRLATAVLAESLPKVIQEISWPKNMRWTGGDGTRFIRPVRWIVALLGGKVVPFEFAGVRAGNKTSGHRFLGREAITITGAADYKTKLRRNFVLADPEERREKVERELARLTEKSGLRIRPDAALLDLVTYLDEYPTAILGDFDPAFLALPKEILITVMRDHQKYFAVEEKTGSLAPHFVAVINLDRDRAGQIRKGHERVLRARFADAQFFWESDLKCRLADNLPKLAGVVYESQLGSYADKVERMRILAAWLADRWAPSSGSIAAMRSQLWNWATQAANLAKCDLVTSMVREFPELQGIVGGLYAQAQGEPQEVADAVYDHYRPLSLEDEIPRNLAGCTVALADKLDALSGCFVVGRIPSGSSDPFGLRRAATGIVKILLEGKLPLSLHAAIHEAFQTLHEQNAGLKATPSVEKQLVDFILDRARFYFQQRKGFAYDEIAATLAAGADDLVDAAERLAAVQGIRGTPNFEPLAVSFKRIRKILEKAGPENGWRQSPIRTERFTDEAERNLHAAAQEVARGAAEHKRSRRYREALELISTLRPTVDRFFDKVLVMAEDEETRKNRLTLLAELLREFSTIADFSEIVTEGVAGETKFK